VMSSGSTHSFGIFWFQYSICEICAKLATCQLFSKTFRKKAWRHSNR
jgi:hypothetical protein